MTQANNQHVLAHRAVMGRFLTTLLNEGLIKGSIEGARVKIPLANAPLWFTVDFNCLPIVEGNAVKMLDPDDIIFPLVHDDNEIDDIESLAFLIASHLNQDVSTVLKEMKSSVKTLIHAYSTMEPLPPMGSDAMAWEHSIIEGHPTHPMNKSRSTNPPMAPILPTQNLKTPTICMFALPTNQVTVRGDYFDHILPLAKGCPVFNPAEMVAIPVHELQVPMISLHFPGAIDLGIRLHSEAQVSLRTVRIEKMANVNFKLPLAAIITSAMRTVSPWSTYLCPDFNRIADAVVEDKKILKVGHEVGSVIANHPDPDVQKHFSCIVRNEAQSLCPGETVIVCAALTEKRHGKYILPELFGLTSEASRLAFFKTYVTLLISSFLPPIVKHGFSFEAHLQNTLARFDANNNLVGFCVRDFGGIKAHAPTLLQSTGLELNVWNEEAIQKAHSLKDVYSVGYHTLVQMHLHRIVRALGFHYSRTGWEIIHDLFDQHIPKEHPARDYFLNTPTALWKAFLSMKFDGLYRDYLYAPTPNLLLLRPAKSISPEVSR
ncbi:hypothetical protein DSO57_1020679 [Entomophthora muscae]|uniref:Uncharacterized protein n=1 Tax=Entomophthora muscae TaxID=34485 RepID=A0ACC2T3H7_9FUNG|nr:hypothetical protein DSO57_1020679 [Entomophthora muscae]